MGSSNLASLSEAGGNNPYHPLSGPLPPHLKNDADRVERDPRPSHCKPGAQTRESEPGGWLSFETTYSYFGSARRSLLKESGPIRESQSRIDVRVREQFAIMLE